MTNNTIFWTQIGSLVGYFFVLFGLYALLVKVKDATIESLQTQLKAAEKNNPDKLVERMTARIEAMDNELEKSGVDIKARQQETAEKDAALKTEKALRAKLEEEKKQLEDYKTKIEGIKNLTEKVLNTMYLPPVDTIMTTEIKAESAGRIITDCSGGTHQKTPRTGD